MRPIHAMNKYSPFSFYSRLHYYSWIFVWIINARFKTDDGVSSSMTSLHHVYGPGVNTHSLYAYRLYDYLLTWLFPRRMYSSSLWDIYVSPYPRLSGVPHHKTIDSNGPKLDPGVNHDSWLLVPPDAESQCLDDRSESNNPTINDLNVTPELIP